jgi:hypothetical protein
VEALLLKAFMTALQNDLIDGMAAVRLLAKQDTLLGKVIGWTISSKYPKHFEVFRSTERAKILEEGKEIRRGHVQALRRQMKPDKDAVSGSQS